jgi:HD superfamily phosphohydrolase
VTLRLDDPLHGVHEIAEPVIAELLASAPLQRLARIHQSGAAWLVRPGRDASRREHTIGVMLLVRRHGGAVAEQVAAVLHDVPHTAFSHVVDRVFENPDDDYHEHHLARVVHASEIPAILARHAVDLDAVLDPKRWPLLEQPQPDLCADRIDYALRDYVRAGLGPRDEVSAFLDDLTVWRERLVCRTAGAAEWFARAYAAVVDGLYMDPLECYADVALVEALRLALRRGVLAESDFFLDDAAVLARLRAADPDVAARLADLAHPRFEPDDQSPTVRLPRKPRSVDPLVLRGDTTVRVSTLSPEVRALNERVLAKARRGVGLRLL